MDRQTIKGSSLIKSIGFDDAQQVLEVEFVKGGVYQYFDVPEVVVRRLRRSESLGKEFYRVVKPYFKYMRVEEEDERVEDEEPKTIVGRPRIIRNARVVVSRGDI